MFGPPQKLQARRVINRIGISVIAAHLEAVGHRHGDKCFHALGGGLPDIFQRGESRVRVDQILDVIVKIGRAETEPFSHQRLLESEIVSFAFLRLQIRVREKIERRKADE